MNFKYKKILTFFAHPDDETLAAGATIHNLSKKKDCEIFVAIPNTGIDGRKNKINIKKRNLLKKSLKSETAQALNKIGVNKKNIFFGNFKDNESDSHSLLEIIHWFENIISKVKPDLVLTHHRYCTNIDHRYCHEAAIVATRAKHNQHIALMAAEVPSSTGYLKPTNWEPNFFYSISETDLEAKINAMETFTSEVQKDPGPRSPEVLRALAKVRGSQSGFYFAESFIILNIYNQ
ncbi:PIG-L family deacetylase [Pelagibacterales bacterium SAG-MED32]|nr:PIG-L family deacetylase [Pelagibacterales bacterium SAG-MED32]